MLIMIVSMKKEIFFFTKTSELNADFKKSKSHPTATGSKGLHRKNKTPHHLFTLQYFICTECRQCFFFGQSYNQTANERSCRLFINLSDSICQHSSRWMPRIDKRKHLLKQHVSYNAMLIGYIIRL